MLETEQIHSSLCAPKCFCNLLTRDLSPFDIHGGPMLKIYEVKLPQADIEFLDGALSYYMTALYLDNDPMREEVMELRVKLNESLTCETSECDGYRVGLGERCGECEEARTDARRTYEGARLAGWIRPADGRVL